jgi:hypothetical protein
MSGSCRLADDVGGAPGQSDDSLVSTICSPMTGRSIKTYSGMDLVTETCTPYKEHIPGTTVFTIPLWHFVLDRFKGDSHPGKVIPGQRDLPTRYFIFHKYQASD